MILSWNQNLCLILLVLGKTILQAGGYFTATDMTNDNAAISVAVAESVLLGSALVLAGLAYNGRRQ